MAKATKKIARGREQLEKRGRGIRLRSPRTAKAKQGESRKGKLSQRKEFTRRELAQTLRQEIDIN
jgi:hypothetical protein